jgi:hypothetical protein
MPLSDADFATLSEAFERLENPSLVVRLSSAFGMPVEAVARQLGKRAPEPLVDAVTQSTHKAIELAMRGSIWTMKDEPATPASPKLHTAAAMTTGAVAGFFGIQALLVELPVTTGIMFRSMADIARAEGESPGDPETAMNVMQVFALGSGVTSADDAAETSYYGARLALGKVVTEALQYVGKHGISNTGAPALVRLVSAIASRFGIVVTQKAMAQAIPLIGAVGGGMVNTVFISHFQDMARGHFAIRRLERKYSEKIVRDAYIRLQEKALQRSSTHES